MLCYSMQEMHSGLKTAQTAYLKEKEAAADAEAKLARARSGGKKEKEIAKLQERAAAAGSKLGAMGDSLRLHEAQCEERQKWLYEEKFPELQARLAREDVRRANQLLTALEA